MKLFPAPYIPTDKIPECRPHIKAGLHKCLYRFSQDDFHELAAVFNGPHPETGEDLVIADEIAPEGAPANDLPPQTAVFAPGPDPEMISEIAARLRKAAGTSLDADRRRRERQLERRREVRVPLKGAEAQDRRSAQVAIRRREGRPPRVPVRALLSELPMRSA